MKPSVFFHFHGELNDFIDQGKRDIPYQYFFEVNSTVKDSIEAQGVPHTEVEWILVNHQSTDFHYRLANQDIIKVYPASVNRTEAVIVRPLLPKIAFMVDANVRKIAKYMRMLGFDTVTDEGIPDEEIAARSWAQNRIVLTRDIGLLKRKNVNYGYFVRHERVEEQVVEVIKRYKLLGSISPFSLCLTCNGGIQEVSKASILDQLPASVREEYDTFYQCLECKKVYWKGSHFDNMQLVIEKLKGE